MAAYNDHIIYSSGVAMVTDPKYHLNGPDGVGLWRSLDSIDSILGAVWRSRQRELIQGVGRSHSGKT